MFSPPFGENFILLYSVHLWRQMPFQDEVSARVAASIDVLTIAGLYPSNARSLVRLADARWLPLQFLPVYTPSEEEKRNPALFAINVRRVMAK